MRIVSSIVKDYGGYELDVNAVGMRSVSFKDIKLPYSGTLPEQIRPVQAAYVYLNVQLVQGARLVLVVDNGKGKNLKRPLDASSEEIITLLDRFFKQATDSTGLDDYWLGVWQAHYIEWKKAITAPDRLLEIISTMPEKDRLFLQEHMMDRAVAS